jgi:hypothetical protein
MQLKSQSDIFTDLFKFDAFSLFVNIFFTFERSLAELKMTNIF